MEPRESLLAYLARQLLHGLSAKIAAPLFVVPGHHYSPIADPAEAQRHLDRLALEGPLESVPGVAIDRDAMRSLWAELVPLMADAPFPEQPQAGGAYHLDNPSFAWGDGLVLHAMLRRFGPRRVIEVGSGYSSACMLATLPGEAEFTFIEPHPRLLRELLGAELDRHVLKASPVQDCPLELFAQLQDGDLLFIDSTHVLKTGSDVWYELFRVLPALAPGVLIHLHDIFWPFEYPRHWVVGANQSWNELYALHAFLMSNADYQVLMFNDYFAQLERPLIEATLPRFLTNPGGSIWLRKLR
ncbi:MAG TPA: class I SAM-dependent methyltransferase [Phenylobacterium sp.]